MRLIDHQGTDNVARWRQRQLQPLKTTSSNYYHLFPILIIHSGQREKALAIIIKGFLFLLMCTAMFTITRAPPSLPKINTRRPSEESKSSSTLTTHIPIKAMEAIISSESTAPTISSLQKQKHCSSLIDGPQRMEKSAGILCCDRSHYRTDVCYMKGDVRMISQLNTFHLYVNPADDDQDDSDIKSLRSKRQELIRPYTRKWETSVMSTIDEIKLKPFITTTTTSRRNRRSRGRSCDVKHNTSAIVFSTGGYTGNVYHEFNDGLIPLYLTSKRFNGEVTFVVLEYHEWWMMKYAGVVRQLSNYDIVDFRKDRRIHCFKEIIIGLKIHDELSIHKDLTRSEKGIQDFQAILGRAFGNSWQHDQQPSRQRRRRKRPKLVILARKKSRALMNLREIVRVAENETGFDVSILWPKMNTEMSYMYKALNSCDVMLGVHGAALTHFLFMRPGSVFIQIVPLGLDWAARTYYGEPAIRLGLNYTEYRINAEESSLFDEYNHTDQVLVQPNSINEKGWWETKKVYLDGQNVRIDVRRFRGVLRKAYLHVLGQDLFHHIN